MRTKVILLLFVTTAASVCAVTPDEKKDPQPSPTAEAAAKNTKDDSVYFLQDIMPMITSLGCSATQCHGSAGGASGLRLSMFAADPKADYEYITRGAEARHINRIQPDKSLLLQKATGGMNHSGGKKIEPGSEQYKMLLSWITNGAPYSKPDAAELVAIKASPASQTLKKGQTQQLKASAEFSDGTEIDVTSMAAYKSSDETIVKVDKQGKLTVIDTGQATVLVTYMRKFDLVQLIIPQELAQPFGDVKTGNKIDELVLAKLKQLGIPPSDPCEDHEFLRRIFLDVTGTLPTVDETRAFLKDTDPEKRAKLIDRLFAGDLFADYWALKWCDLLRVKSEYPSNLWPNAVQAYYHWIRNSIARNKPYDQFAREMIVSSGSNFRNSEVNFYRAFLKRDAQSLSEATALIFMGARTSCARCHAHPTEEWDLDDNLALAAFFAKVGYKKTLEWKEEIVYFNRRGSLRHPLTRQVVQPAFLGAEPLELPVDRDPRAEFAEWLTAPDNPYFAKNIVNRIWFWLFNRGIVHDPDDFRPTNPPTNPQLLDYLAKELVEHKYDLRHIYRLVLNSGTYRRSARANEFNAKDNAHFSHYLTKRLTAEQLLDAVNQITETSDQFTSRVPEPYTILPRGHRAVQLADGTISTPFLELFGRPSRNSPFESERSCETSMRQALHFINSSHIENKVAGSPWLKRLLASGKTNEELVTEIYLTAIARFPADEEKQSVLDYIGTDNRARRQAFYDFVWAIMNTKEFMFNH